MRALGVIRAGNTEGSLGSRTLSLGHRIRPQAAEEVKMQGGLGSLSLTPEVMKLTTEGARTGATPGTLGLRLQATWLAA